MAVNIYISKDENGSGNGKSNSSNSNAMPKLEDLNGGGKVLSSIVGNQIVQSLKSSASSMFNFGISTYGDLTGDYIQQAKVQSQLSLISGVSTDAMAIGGAFATGNPIAIATTVATLGISKITKQIQNNIQYNRTITKANQKANFNSNRIGDILVNGNREV